MVREGTVQVLIIMQGQQKQVVILLFGYKYIRARFIAVYAYMRDYSGKNRTRLDLLSIPQSGGKKCQNV